MAEKFTLPEEIIEVQHIERATGLITDKSHIAYGGLLDGSTVTLPAHKLRNGNYSNVLTTEEKKELEGILGLPENGLSIYRKGEEDYWKSLKIILSKTPITLNLSEPEDYIKYKQLLAYNDLIATNLKLVEPILTKQSYRFVIVRKDDEARIKLTKLDINKEAYKFLGKIEDNKEAMVDYLTVSNIKVSADTSADALRAEIGKIVVDTPKKFVDTLKDESYNTRVLLYKSIVAGNIIKKGNFYYTKDNEALAEPNEPSTLENVINYLESNVNQEYRVLLKTKLDK